MKVAWNSAFTRFSVPWLLPWKTGRFYSIVFGNAFTTLNPTNANIYLFPVYIPNVNGVTVSNLGFESTVTGTTARIAIYECSDGEIPDDLILDSGSILASATGHQKADVSQFLPQGWYIVGFIGHIGTIRAHASFSLTSLRGFPGIEELGLPGWSNFTTSFSGDFSDILSNGFPKKFSNQPFQGIRVSNLQIPRVIIGV